MGSNKILNLFFTLLIFVILGLIVDAFIPTLLQLTSVAIQSANNTGFGYLDGIIVIFLFVVIVSIVLTKLSEIR